MRGLSHEQRRKLRGDIAARVSTGEGAVRLAAEYGVSTEYVANACKQAGIKYRHDDAKPGSPISLPPTKRTIWDCVDWSRQDAEIAKVLRLSRERVRQIRRLRGEADSVNFHSYGIAKRFRDYVRSNADKLHGQTVKQIVDGFDSPVSPGLARHAIASAGIRISQKPASPFRAIPWDLVDWRLPNCVLFRVWGIVAGSQAFGQRRSNFQYGRATLIDGPEAEAAEAAERAKAAAWFNTPDGKVAKMAARAYASAS